MKLFIKLNGIELKFDNTNEPIGFQSNQLASS